MKHVLIIGGGFCGITAAKHLERHYSVTLIDKKDYFEYTPSILKYLAGSHEHLRIPYKEILCNSRILKGEAVYKDRKVVFNKKDIPFDYLILATGYRALLPITGNTCFDGASSTSLRDARSLLKKAKEILVIGGGYIGVELAGELITHYSQKKVTIVHGASRLLERDAPAVSKYAEKLFRKKDVKLIFNEFVISEEDNTFTTRSGKKIKADIAFICAGTLPNTLAIEHPCIDERRRVIVNSFLQIEKEKNVFAGGDITNILEEKTAQNAEAHGHLIAKNILREEKGKELKKYRPSSKAMIISIGDRNAILTYKQFFLPGMLPGILKHLVERHIISAIRKR